jgi:hypothetical protein
MFAFSPKMSVIVVSFLAAGMSASCAKTPDALQENNSNVTAISLSLPAKSSLPADVAAQLTHYEFRIDSASPALADSPASECSRVDQTAAYTEKVTLNAKLKRGCYYHVSILIGQAAANGKISMPMAVALTETAAAPASVVYMGNASIDPADMEGKDKLPLSIKLIRIDMGDQGEVAMPDSITASSGDIDVDVQVEFPTAEDEANQGKINTQGIP